MKLYQEFLKTRQRGESFTKWLLIRKMTFRHQCIVIILLNLAWLLVAPHLIFWIYFFKGAVLIGVILVIIEVGKKIVKGSKK